MTYVKLPVTMAWRDGHLSKVNVTGNRGAKI